MRAKGKDMVKGNLYKLQFVNKYVCHTVFNEVFGHIHGKLALFICEAYYNDYITGGGVSIRDGVREKKMHKTYRFVIDGQLMELPGDDFDVYMIADKV
jgi:hypothetical protein|tara:strand:- start:314 stop:607 length:294 start_codon:yes stop_codon:yes gene_type:complete